MNLQIGYFADFKETNTILISGDAEGLLELARLLRNLEDAHAEAVSLHRLPFIHAYGGLHLSACPAGDDGVRRIGASSSFKWHHSQEGWLESAEKIEVVAHEDRPGHNYLGATAAEDAVIMVSKGEYDRAWWKEHGER